MGGSIVAGSLTERHHAVAYLRRKARSVRLQAERAAPTLAEQLLSLATLIEAEVDQLENSTCASALQPEILQN